MKRRVFICSNTIFPRRCASANYIQYLALALIESKCEVVVISFGDKKSCEYNEKKDRYYYKSIIFEEILIRALKPLHWLDYKYRLGGLITDILNKYNPSSRDIILAYFTQKNVLNALLNFARDRRVKTAVCIGEWFSKSHFRHDIFGLKYKSYVSMFERLIPKYDIAMPVSTHIDNYLKSLGCNTFILPPMADPYEHNTRISKARDDIIRYLYIGKLQDSLETVLKAFELLPVELLSKMELHMKGITQKQIKSILGSDMYKHISNIIKFHGWMEYNELIELYKSTDFLLLAREANQETLSNFPSKIPEVMSYGVIPIVSDVGDYTRYYLSDCIDSVFARECDAQSFSEVIIKSLSMDKEARKAMSDRALSTVRSKLYYRKWKDSIYNALFCNNIGGLYEDYTFDYGKEGTAVRKFKKCD